MGSNISVVNFAVYDGDLGTGKGVSFSCTNMRSLSDKIGVSYDTLVGVFSRRRLNYWVSPGGTVVIKTEILFKGLGRNKRGFKGFK